MTERLTNKELNFSQAMQALSWGREIHRKSWPEEKSFAVSDDDMIAQDWIAKPLPEETA